MNFIKNWFSKLLVFFRSGKAEAAFNTVADLIPKVLPIVQMIAALTPTKADDEILNAFSEYGIPANLAQIRTTPADQRGYLLLQLATQIASKRFPGIATNILNSAVQLAVTGIKAG